MIVLTISLYLTQQYPKLDLTLDPVDASAFVWNVYVDTTTSFPTVEH